MAKSLRIDASDKEVAEWLRKLDKAGQRDIRYEKDAKGNSQDVNYTGATSLLGRGQARP